MEWHREKMLPRGLPELVYSITPPRILKNLKVISLNRKEKRGNSGNIGWHDGYWKMNLYPTVILAHPSGHCDTLSFSYWQAFLKTMLHEIGHIMTLGEAPEGCQERYNDDTQCHQVIERLADEWRDRAIKVIASRDPRLGQPPGWIGGLSGLYILGRAKRKEEDGLFNNVTHQRIKNIRAYRCGGQHGIDDIMRMAHGWFSPVIRRRVRQRIKRLASSMGITRDYIDRAGRKHMFFNHGEAVVMSAELVKTIPKSWYIDNTEKENERE